MFDGLNGLSGILGLLVIFYGLLFLLYVLPSLITTAQLYAKAGKPTWAAIVPVYNSVVLAEIGRKPAWMGWLTGALLIVPNVLALSDNNALGGIEGLASLASLVFSIILLIAFIKAYRASAGFWVAYLLLPIVAVFLVKNVTFGGGTVAAPIDSGDSTGPVASAATWPTTQTPSQPLPQPANNQTVSQQDTPGQ